jgi:hypothetical protein
MKRTAIVALILSMTGLGTALISGEAAAAAPAPHARHACTKTSTGHCIAGGQFCPQASYGHAGYDARGRRYICKGDHVHPHWMLP